MTDQQFEVLLTSLAPKKQVFLKKILEHALTSFFTAVFLGAAGLAWHFVTTWDAEIKDMYLRVDGIQTTFGREIAELKANDEKQGLVSDVKKVEVAKSNLVANASAMEKRQMDANKEYGKNLKNEEEKISDNLTRYYQSRVPNAAKSAK